MATAKTGYVDGFILVVPKKNLAHYRRMAKAGERIWRTYGALDYKECIGDDLTIKGSMDMPAPLSFVKMAKAKPGETVWFSYITYKSRAHRDQVNKKVIAHMQREFADEKGKPMPFDMKRMAYGGFKVVVG